MSTIWGFLCPINPLGDADLEADDDDDDDADDRCPDARAGHVAAEEGFHKQSDWMCETTAIEERDESGTNNDEGPPGLPAGTGVELSASEQTPETPRISEQNNLHRNESDDERHGPGAPAAESASALEHCTETDETQVDNQMHDSFEIEESIRFQMNPESEMLDGDGRGTNPSHRCNTASDLVYHLVTSHAALLEETSPAEDTALHVALEKALHHLQTELGAALSATTEEPEGPRHEEVATATSFESANPTMEAPSQPSGRGSSRRRSSDPACSSKPLAKKVELAFGDGTILTVFARMDI